MRKYGKGRRSRFAGIAAGLLSLGLVAAACGGGGNGGGGGGDGAAGGGGDGGANKSDPVQIGYINWDEDVAVTELWQYLLEERGYTVETTQLQVGALFSGMAQGDLDLFLDTWLPATHEDYWNQYGDQLTQVTQWYDQASLEIAVPEYAPIDSIEELPEYAGQVDGEIIGIEPGAGLTDATENDVIPQYDLGNDFRLVTGSTPTMLSALEQATQNEEPIVVTLWHPHWAYAAYPIKDLEDPQNALGDAEQIYATAPNGFSDEHPQVAEWIGNFKLNDEQLSSLENLVLQKNEDNPQQGVEEWISQNQDVVNQWVGESSG